MQEQAEKRRLERKGVFWVPIDDAEVDKLFLDYLKKLYSSLPSDWQSQAVDYIFSVPAIWNDQPDVRHRFRSLFRDAGFGSKPNQRAFLGDTEAVAAAAQALYSQKYRVCSTLFQSNSCRNRFRFFTARLENICWFAMLAAGLRYVLFSFWFATNEQQSDCF